MIPKQSTPAYTNPQFHTTIFCLNRFARVSLVIFSLVLATNIRLVTATIKTLGLISPPCTYATSSEFATRTQSLSRVDAEVVLSQHHSLNSHLMFRRFHHLAQNSSSRLLAMGNDKKRMSSYSNSLPDNTKKFLASVEVDQQQEYRPLVIVIAGPTGVGKSDVAAELCSVSMASDIIFHHMHQAPSRRDIKLVDASLKTRGHVVSADSVQVYRGVDIGANKPSVEERKRTPHHLVDIVDPLDASDSNKVSSYNAADWMRDAEHVIRKLTLCDDNDEIQVKTKHS